MPRSTPAITRRQLTSGALAAVAARSPPAGLTLAAFGGWFETAFDQTILGAFRKSHPEISVFYYPLANSFQLLGMLRGQRVYPSTDIALLDSGVASLATADGLFDPLTPETMPALRDLIPEALIEHVAGPALVLDSLALAYSPERLAQPPKFWRNLWNPAYGTRIALQTPPDPAALAITAVAGTLFGGGDLYRSLDLGLTALAQLAPRVTSWDPTPDIYTAIALGDANIGPGWNARAQSQALLTPGRFAASIPDDGSPVRTITINLVKGAPQPAAARTLIAWLLAPEAQRLLAEAMCFAPVNPKTGLSNDALARAGASPAVIARRMPMDWVAINAIRGQIAAEWRRRNLASR